MGCGTCFCLLVNSCKLMISVEREIYRVNLNVYIYMLISCLDMRLLDDPMFEAAKALGPNR